MEPFKTKQTTELSENLLNQFMADFSGSIIMKDDPLYHEERKLWNKMIDKKPALIAQCREVEDVIQAVRFARENDLLVSVRGGGHNVAGNAMNDGGMVIDLSRMRSVWVDPENKTAKIQGGATWADVDRETQVFGLACTGGVVSETGVGGLTLNGGFSWFRRKAGMSIDNLTGADMVLADGRYVHVSENENSDLFWAIRGGGGNFGIVTSFDFKLQELGPEVMFAACMYPRAEAEKVMNSWREYTKHIPGEITTDCFHWTIPEFEAFPAEVHNREVTVLAGMYAGPAELGKEALQPLRNVTTPLLDLSNVYPYVAVQSMFDPIMPKNKFSSYWKSLFLKDISGSLQERIIKLANELPTPHSLLFIRNLGGAISQVATDATAFGDRSARFLLSFEIMWLDSAEEEKCIQWTKNAWEEIKKFSDGQVYFNFNSDTNGSSDMLKESYGRNYARLVEIKTKYDPDNFFRMNANIAPRKEMLNH
jgi:hypothetical protein